MTRPHWEDRAGVQGTGFQLRHPIQLTFRFNVLTASVTKRMCDAFRDLTECESETLTIRQAALTRL